VFLHKYYSCNTNFASMITYQFYTIAHPKRKMSFFTSFCNQDFSTQIDSFQIGRKKILIIINWGIKKQKFTKYDKICSEKL